VKTTRKCLGDWGIRQFHEGLGSVSGQPILSECWHGVHCTRQVESELGTSGGQAMRKMQAESLAELVRMAADLQLLPGKK
jgi:hypothetical protein